MSSVRGETYNNDFANCGKCGFREGEGTTKPFRSRLTFCSYPDLPACTPVHASKYKRVRRLFYSSFPPLREISRAVAHCVIFLSFWPLPQLSLHWLLVRALRKINVFASSQLPKYRRADAYRLVVLTMEHYALYLVIWLSRPRYRSL